MISQDFINFFPISSPHCLVLLSQVALTLKMIENNRPGEPTFDVWCN
jgi:hypothetical protein